MLKMTNNATSLLASSINTETTTVVVASGDEGKFPNPGEGEWFPVTVVDGAGNMEIMRCTARSGVNLTVSRAQEGTTAKSFDAGSRVDVRLTAAALATKADDAATAAALATKADADGMFYRPDHTTPVFEKTGAGTISIKAGAIIEVGRQLFTFSTATAVTMPALTAGTDYIIWIEPDGDLVANTNFSSPAVAGSRRLGGFHYAPGGNAAAFNSGGNTTPGINEHSIWDLKFRPACPDPRGMALIANSFWCDIYLLGVDHHVNGTSKYNVTIADGSSPPKVPTAFGGNGSTAYSSLTWFEAAEVIQSHGKQLLSYDEFAAAMYGTKEAQAGGTDPVSTILRADYTSKWGIMLATGNMWVWGRDFGGNYGAASYVSQGRGSAYLLSNVAILGGAWGDGANAGSRASYWDHLPSDSFSLFGARGRSDHLSHV